MNLAKLQDTKSLAFLYTNNEKAQAGIKIAERNISNFRNADDTTLMAERKRN